MRAFVALRALAALLAAFFGVRIFPSATAARFLVMAVGSIARNFVLDSPSNR